MANIPSTVFNGRRIFKRVSSFGREMASKKRIRCGENEDRV
jgi:hypothetical protein